MPTQSTIMLEIYLLFILTCDKCPINTSFGFIIKQLGGYVDLMLKRHLCINLLMHFEPIKDFLTATLFGKHYPHPLFIDREIKGEIK